MVALFIVSSIESLAALPVKHLCCNDSASFQKSLVSSPSPSFLEIGINLTPNVSKGLRASFTPSWNSLLSICWETTSSLNNLELSVSSFCITSQGFMLTPYIFLLVLIL